MTEAKTLFGMRMKELRKNQGLSQEQLAEKVDISSKYVSRVEMGYSFPSLDTLEKLASALNVELKDFFEFSHKTPNQKELKETLNTLLKEADEEKTRLLVKIARAVVR
ncbi:MAG: helix-turn-helix domain-containing protein [Deltaproteobacteria bacterium]|nr:helix-turn-helix domain-containing protein [Deltaproteobacteria bacterium]